MEPVLTVAVEAQEQGCTIQVIDSALEITQASGAKSVYTSADEDLDPYLATTSTSTSTSTSTNEVQPPFRVRMRNDVRAVVLADDSTTGSSTSRTGSGSGSGSGTASRHQVGISSDLSLTVEVDLPRWFLVPSGVVRVTGQQVLKTVVGQMVPRFLDQLRDDYTRWSLGDDSRT